MFVSFSIKNAYSFYDTQTLCARAVKTCKERLNDATFPTFQESNDRLVKTLAIYGANASGKSNLFYALWDMRHIILTSASESQSGEYLKLMPFLFLKDNETNDEKPTTFTIEFIINDHQYKYSFSATTKHIVNEFLVKKSFRTRKYKELFSRIVENGENKIVCKNDFTSANSVVVPRTRTNALFLSTCAMLALPEAEKIVNFFSTQLRVIASDRMTLTYTSKILDQGLYRDEILRFLKITDPGISDISIQQHTVETDNVLPDGSKETRTMFNPLITPILTDGSVSPRTIPFQAIASLGTEKAFSLSAHIFEALANGTILALDELDSRLHPLLTKEIIKLFNSQKTNPNNAQLIFNTHDTNLLGVRIYDEIYNKRVYLLRRDEIYFIEKNGAMCSKIYSLIDFKKHDGLSVRKDASHEKEYLAGLYGAIPYIGKM